MKKFVTILAATTLVLAALLLPATALTRVADAIPDSWQDRYDLSTDYNQEKFDPDQDALNNLNEYRSHTSPRDADTDNDGVRDADEDADHDRLTNLQEQRQGTNPGDPDTNDDGVADDGGPVETPSTTTPPLPAPTGAEVEDDDGQSQAGEDGAADEGDEAGDDCHHDQDEDSEQDEKGAHQDH